MKGLEGCVSRVEARGAGVEVYFFGHMMGVRRRMIDYEDLWF